MFSEDCIIETLPSNEWAKFPTYWKIEIDGKAEIRSTDKIPPSVGDICTIENLQDRLPRSLASPGRTAHGCAAPAQPVSSFESQGTSDQKTVFYLNKIKIGNIGTNMFPRLTWLIANQDQTIVGEPLWKHEILLLNGDQAILALNSCYRSRNGAAIVQVQNANSLYKDSRLTEAAKKIIEIIDRIGPVSFKSLLSPNAAIFEPNIAQIQQMLPRNPKKHLKQEIKKAIAAGYLEQVDEQVDTIF